MQNKQFPETANVTLGDLLSPEELQQDFNTLKQRPTASGYALYATLPDAVVRHLESALLPHGAQLGIARTPGGIICAVLATQAGPVQVRFIVPLLTDKAKAWLTEAAEEKHQMQFTVEIVETHQLALVQVINPLADDTQGQWPALKAMLDKPMPRMDLLEQAQELKSLLGVLADERESLLPGLPIKVVWYVLVTEFLVPPEPGSASHPSGSVH
uniref:Putative Urocanate hydratase n=1 Tax=mine drainage metagenome TaxID=410659 RepID=E6PJY2_9ZZZZ